MPGLSKFAAIVAVASAIVGALPVSGFAQSAFDRDVRDRILRQQQERRQRQLDRFRSEQRERANQARQERNRAVERGADRATREYYGTARGTRSRPPTSVPPYSSSRGGSSASVRCRRWQNLCRRGRKSYCRLFTNRC